MILSLVFRTAFWSIEIRFSLRLNSIKLSVLEIRFFGDSNEHLREGEIKDNEEGCLLYQLAKDRKEKGKYYVLEVYASGDAVKTHMKNLGKNRNPAMGKLMDTSKKTVISVMPVIGNPVRKL